MFRQLSSNGPLINQFHYKATTFGFFKGDGRGWIKMMNDCDVFVKLIFSLLREQSQ